MGPGEVYIMKSRDCQVKEIRLAVVLWRYFKSFCGSYMVSKLNMKGNSELGMHALELLTNKTGMSIFLAKKSYCFQ
jgi:hypothetical protein